MRNILLDFFFLDYWDVILCSKEYKFILSNSDVKGENINNDFFDNLYKQFNIKRVYATRMVNSNAEKRGKLTELLITN